jgi:hypothetical protein
MDNPRARISPCTFAEIPVPGVRKAAGLIEALGI